jgi:uncharacterized membrane protein YcaP (DUF421 family)
MWNLENPWWEYIFRAGLIYAAVFLLLRIVGKKQIGEMSPFDLVLLLIISEAVSAAITGGDNSLTAGLIAVTTFIGLNYVLDVLMFKSKKIEKILDGEPRLLAADGKINQKVQASEKITQEEIESVLREHGLDDLKDVAYAVLETNGQISIIPKGKAHKEIHNPNQDRPI